MGTWIGHLRIAENLLAVLPGLDEAAFACGNLAPDSGVPNADWTAFDPPKEVTHFLRPGEEEGRSRDLEFYRGYLMGVRSDEDRARWSFLLGYFFHLVCDNLWALRVWRPSKHTYAVLIAERGLHAALGEMKRDWYGLDHRYVRDHPDSLFWRVFLRAPNPPVYLPFVPEAALHQQLDHIRRFYSEPGDRVLDRVYPYLNEATMARFCADSTDTLLRIYGRLGELAASGAETALALLPEGDSAPYPGPFGDDPQHSPPDHVWQGTGR